MLLSGNDYNAIEEFPLVFQPEERRITLPITILDNSIPEPTEEFRLVLSQEMDSPDLVLDRQDTIISIEDSDGTKNIPSSVNYID